MDAASDSLPLDVILPWKREDLQSQIFGKEAVVYDEVAKRVHVLNHTAHEIWKYCDGQSRVNDLVVAFRRQYRCPDETQLLHDIQMTLRQLESLKLTMTAGQK